MALSLEFKLMRGKKRTTRLKRQSYLIVTEGAEDEAFIKHLRNCYQSRDISIRASNSAGGFPSTSVIKANKMNNSNQFNKCIALIDSDRSTEEIETAKTLAASTGVNLILSDHCLQAELLRIISVRFKQNESAKKLKHSLEALLTGPSTVSNSYECKFSKPILSRARKSSTWLNTLITICEGSFK